jgi:hypothetical protein
MKENVVHQKAFDFAIRVCNKSIYLLQMVKIRKKGI